MELISRMESMTYNQQVIVSRYQGPYGETITFYVTLHQSDGYHLRRRISLRGKSSVPLANLPRMTQYPTSSDSWIGRDSYAVIEHIERTGIA